MKINRVKQDNRKKSFRKDSIFLNIYYFFCFYRYIFFLIIGIAISAFIFLFVIDFIAPKTLKNLDTKATLELFEQLQEANRHQEAIILMEYKGDIINGTPLEIEYKSKLSDSYIHVGDYSKAEKMLLDVWTNSQKYLAKYLGNEKPILCKCKVCGNEWNTLPKVLITNGSGCPVCGKKKSIQAETKTKEQFVKEMKIVNKDIEIVGDYVNTHTKIKCFCKVCHTTWYGYPANLLNRSTGCPRCNMSIGEKALLDTLNELGIVYTSQYCINDGKHRKPLRIDAFDKENNIAFEFNGEQHYYPVDFAGRGTEWAENQFNLTIERDKAKEQYCLDNGIHLIIVPYWEKRNIKNFLINKIKELNLKIA